MRKVVHRYTKDDKIFVYQMLRLRSEGFSYVKIGAMFNKHHSTIIHWCKKFKVDKGTEFPGSSEVTYIVDNKIVPNWHKYREILDEPINTGKLSYKEYLLEAQMREGKNSIYNHVNVGKTTIYIEEEVYDEGQTG